MNSHIFSLKPFGGDDSPQNFNITGNITRQDHQLAINYLLGGNLTEIAIATPSDTPVRKYNLWEDTCFEFFLAIKNSPQYWEFNLSPAGHWNAFHLDGYRQGLQEESVFTKLPFSVQHQSDSLIVALNIDLDKIVPADQTIKVAITTVIKYINGEVNYWALTHLGAEPDFHLRDSFVLEL